jgi:HNH endonuclease
VWEQVNGPIPEGMVVMHLCDNPPCYRYDHLRLGTNADNMADMVAKGRAHHDGRCGEVNGSAKLTAAEVVEIRAAIAAGEPQKDLAERYSVSKATITFIKQRKIWTSL